MYKRQEECFEMVHYAEPGKKPKWGYVPSEGHPDVVTSFEGTRACLLYTSSELLVWMMSTRDGDICEKH